ncbi:MmcQ/YjbR family DNA-binding protein [Kangiella marina]
MEKQPKMFAHLEQFSSNLKGAEFDLKWETERTYCVAGKMFVVFYSDSKDSSKDNGSMDRASFKVTPADFMALTDRDGIIPAPYLARYHWVSVESCDALTQQEFEQLIQQSYDMVFSKLTKKKQQEILNKAP